jgi:hypothetical protein
MNRGGLGARSLNIELQNALNPPGEICVGRFGWAYCPGDKVMQIENDYDKEVYNALSRARPSLKHRGTVSVTGTLSADRGTTAVPCCSQDEDEPSKPPIVLWRRTPVFSRCGGFCG